jgi:hypothetical protein
MRIITPQTNTAVTTPQTTGKEGFISRLKKRFGPVTYKREPDPRDIRASEEAKYKANLGKTLMQLESSGGTNKANADPGEMRWLTGLTTLAVKELERLGRLSPTFDENKKEDVVDASVEYFSLMKERNPKKRDSEVYTDGYWTQATSATQRNKKMSEFEELMEPDKKSFMERMLKFE